MNDLFVKIFLPVFLFLYIEVAFLSPSLKVWGTTGINPLAFSIEDNIHNYIGKWFRILSVLIIFSVVTFIIGDQVYQYLLPAHYLEFKWARVTAIVLCFLSLLTTVLSHFDMAQFWRIGIDRKSEAPLVQKGLFSRSRNPFFLSLIVILVCFFILIPNAITLLVMVAGYILIQLQVRLEEEFLMQKHGEVYRQYCEKVRRWF
ncbi:MAG: isoprenylcysteine carboxylmethyltransferase family protein [Marivirga sp.]|nr:isoprenylcysteine carboxylmethyltransferase family protein [Marivirga sp.]